MATVVCHRLSLAGRLRIPLGQHDGTVLDAAETAAGRLEVAEMRRQVDRIRRDNEDDPEALVGHAKELVESAFGATARSPLPSK
jgi:hypothetical protein